MLWRFCIGELLWVRRMGCPKAVPVSAPVTCAESSSDTVIRGSLFSEQLVSLDPGFGVPERQLLGSSQSSCPRPCVRGPHQNPCKCFFITNLGIWLREHKPETEVSLCPGVGVRSGVVYQITKWRAVVWSELASLLISSTTSRGLRFVTSCPRPHTKKNSHCTPLFSVEHGDNIWDRFPCH